MGDLVSSRMLDGLTKFFPASCTIQSATLTRDGFGQPIQSWSTVTGLSSLAVRVASATAIISGNEFRALGILTEETTHIALLQGHYATITPAMQAVIAGVTYNITAVRHDGSDLATYLGLKLVVGNG
jgi:SPP1 family predicted phage head-tail adaptor